MLTRYDLLLGRVIEGFFALGQKELHPVEIDARLRALALEKRETHETGTVAPNLYRVALPKESFDEMAPLWPLVSEELALSLEEFARGQGFGFLGPVRVSIVAGGESGKIHILAQFAE